METQRLLLYIAFSFVSLILYQTWVVDNQPVPVTQSESSVAGQTAGAGDLPDTPTTATAALAAGSINVPDETLSTPVVSVKTDVLDVEISTLGATIVSVLLDDYPVSVKEPDVPFMLMSNDPAHFLVAQSGLLNADPKQNAAAGEPANVPNHQVQMTVEADSYELSNGDTELKVPFYWTSEDGKKVTKTLTFTKGSYEVNVDYVIENGSESPWAVNQYRQLKRKPGTKDEKQQFVNTFIGGVISTPEKVYEKISFGNMEDEKLNMPLTNGWVAMIQHYFAAAWIPAEGEANTAYTKYLPNEQRYVIGIVSAPQIIQPGTQIVLSNKAYIGPKIQDTLAAAAPNLELTVDFGWLTILAQPLFWLLKTIHGFIGNWGWAIIFTTFAVKALFYKLSEVSYRSMANMKKLQPKLAELKERHGDDRTKMGQATMELYKKEKVNPLGGCIPMLIPIPVFIALYWVLLESVELRQAPWMFHIQDLSIRDPYFILPVIMAATMFFQQKLNPAPVDPIQAKVMQFLPLIFGVFFAMFPAGLVLYWVVNNTLSIAQQYYITKIVLAEGKGGNKKAVSSEPEKETFFSKLTDKAAKKMKELEEKQKEQQKKK